eukprot:9536858-Alexandrium_andersonii.AAC.1
MAAGCRASMTAWGGPANRSPDQRSGDGTPLVTGGDAVSAQPDRGQLGAAQPCGKRLLSRLRKGPRGGSG